MTSPAAPLGRYSPTPPPPPPKERRPTIQTSPSSIRSPNTQSPVRRKPVPSSAVSPPLAAQYSANNSPQIFGQIVEHLRGRAQPENHNSVTHRDRGDNFTAPGAAHQPPPTKNEPHQTQSPVVTRTYSDAESLSRSSSNRSRHRVEADRRPEPSTSDNQQGDSYNVCSPEPAVVEDMALKPGTRPPPLRTESTSSVRSQTASDAKKPQTPGGKFTSFFARRPSGSPGSESSYSDHGKSPVPSPNPKPEQISSSGGDYAFPRQPTSQSSQDSIDFDPSAYTQSDSTMDRASQLEAELREISKELAGSIKREMDLEDMVERLQAEAPSATMAADRTSDYFSDSGTSSIRPPTSEYSPKEEVERIKREADQQRASLKVDFSHKWQRELATRKAMESHLQYMEQKYSQGRQQISDSSDVSSRARELESALDDARRRLTEERQTKENFEDLLTALRHDLEGHRNERDNLRDEIVPQLKSRIEGLEATLAELQKSPYDHARMQHELQSLRDENAALHSARMMNAQFGSIAEEDEMVSSPQNSLLGRIGGGLQRSTTLGRSNSRAGLNRSNSLSRSNSVSKGVQQELPQNIAEQLKAIEQQRDALHTAVKYLLKRQTMHGKQYERRLKVAELERAKAERADSFNALTGIRKGGYEREVRGLRSEINLLRKRADDALEQKWQCEKGLAGLKMDLDRSKQETEGLHKLLQATDNSDPEVLSSTLQTALSQLQQQSAHARSRDTLGSLANEQQLAEELEDSTERSEALATQVRRQLKTNSGLRNRLKDAIEKGERDQLASAAQINQLQEKLRKLEDTITSTQTQSETAVMKHEEDIRVLRASHNSHLLRAKVPNNGLLSPTLRSPLSPMFSNSKRSPRLDKTSTGPGMPLHQVLKTEYLEKKVEELEKALSDAEKEMGEVVSRMNTAQIGVADLEGERDEALRQTRRLEAAIGTEREKVRMLFGGLDLPER